MNHTLAGLAGATVLALCAQADAGSHLWRFNEIYSNADGTIMFIELKECCGAANETQLAGKDISSASGGEFIFPANLPCSNCTANKHLLLATQAYADLPGVPAPDYIIDESFFDVNGDTLTYWFYGDATWSFGTVPTDGVLSLTMKGEQVNSPTNFAGESGTIELPGCDNPADITGDGVIDVQDLVEVIVNWGPNPGNPADVNGDGVVNVEDLVAVIVSWGDCS